MADLLFSGSTWINVDQVLHNLDRVYSRVSKELDLSITAAYLLWSLSIQDGQRPSDLARTVGRESTSFTPILDELERKGLTERRRNPADRRSVRVYLTTTGDQLSRRVAAHFEATEANIQQSIGVDELSDFLRVILMLQTTQGKQTGDT